MSQRLVEIYANPESRKAVMAAIASSKAGGAWETPCENGQIRISVLIAGPLSQGLLDKLQGILGHSTGSRIIVLPVETTLPKPEELPKPGGKVSKAAISREELYDDVAQGATLDRNYLLLVLFSTVVAAIGLIEDNVAVIIGAMVIAPFLGPNLALALATTLGDLALVRKAVVTNLAGIALTIPIAMAIGAFWPGTLTADELLSRTDVGFDGIALALASGAAAVLSLTTGLASVLVGVMVAVALLPPAATLGIMLGRGEFDLAFGAFLLLTVNVVCVNLSAKIVFLAKGMRPRTWTEKRLASRASIIVLAGWIIALAALAGAIVARGGVDVYDAPPSEEFQDTAAASSNSSIMVMRTPCTLSAS